MLFMQEKNPNLGEDPKKKQEWPETGKQGGQGQGDAGKKGGDFGEVDKKREGSTGEVDR
jgi:hypothetical protein